MVDSLRRRSRRPSNRAAFRTTPNNEARLDGPIATGPRLPPIREDHVPEPLPMAERVLLVWAQPAPRHVDAPESV
jgi:hypothetical protein